MTLLTPLVEWLQDQLTLDADHVLPMRLEPPEHLGNAVCVVFDRYDWGEEIAGTLREWYHVILTTAHSGVEDQLRETTIGAMETTFLTAAYGLARDSDSWLDLKTELVERTPTRITYRVGVQRIT